MADEIDLADEVTETMLKAQIARARKQQQHIPATGHCLYCDAPLDDSKRRWCDADCRDDWEQENKD